MSDTKRSRGRPRGTGLNDSPTLRKVADMVTADPKLRATTAIKQILDKPSTTVIRRLQGKWREQKATYLAEAQKQRAAKPLRRSSSTSTPNIAHHISEAHRRMHELMSPTMQAARGITTSPTMLAAQGAVRQFRENSALKTLMDAHNNSAIRAMRELQESPIIRAIQEAQNSPAARAIQEAQKRVKLLTGY